MINVTINYTSVDNCSPVTNALSVTSDEPVDGTGDGNTSPDWVIIDDHQVRLRAERDGGGDGRVYTITITSTDDCGNTTTATTTVLVPHDAPGLYLVTPQAPSAMSLDVRPNPTAGDFNISVGSDDATEVLHLAIYDVFGRIVEERAMSGGSRLSIGEKFAPGHYVLRLTQGNGQTEIRQMIKIR
jgi:hypothetical protein